MSDCLIGFGSNLGDREESLQRALDRLRGDPDFAAVRCSRTVTSTPVGGPPGQSSYLNAAIRLETSLPPDDLLRTLLGIENQLGRERHERWGARTIDLDLLLVDDLCRDSRTLVLPHPRMVCRWFVLRPAAEIAGTMVHPGCGWAVAALDRHLATYPEHVAIGGEDPVEVIAAEVADRLGGRHFSSTHSGGPSKARSLEFLSETAAAAMGWLDEHPGRLAVSDFRLDPAVGPFRYAVPPKLLVWVAGRTGPAAPFLRGCGGPYITVSASTIAQVTDDIVACVQSMRPEV